MSSNLPVSTQAAGDAAIIEQVVIGGDLSKMNPQMRVNYYMRVCDSLRLNPYTQPFAYINLNGKLTLYAKRDCTDQLRKNNGVSITIKAREAIGDVYVVTAQAADQGGRVDESTGCVCITGLKGEALANAYMKAETKAKRRVTLSVCGLGWMDESEADSVPGAQVMPMEPLPSAPAPAAVREPGEDEGPAPEWEGEAVPAPKKPSGGKPITEKQVARVYAISKQFGVTDADLHEHLVTAYGIASVKEIPMADADDVFTWISGHGSK